MPDIERTTSSHRATWTLAQIAFRNAGHFVNAGDAFENAAVAALAQSQQAVLQGDVADLGRAGSFNAQVPHGVVAAEQLKDADAAGEAGVPTVSAAGGFEEPFGERTWKIGGDVVVGRAIRGFALGAQPADQSLSHDSFDGARAEVRFDTHVHQPRERAGGVIGVQSAEDQMPRQRRLDRAFGGFVVANLTDQDHVRVVTQDAPQAGGERQADLWMHVNLADAVHVVFDGVFHRDDLQRRVFDLVQGTVQRGRFAAAGRAGDQHDAVRHRDQFLERLLDVWRHPDVRQVEDHAPFIQEAQHNPFAEEHRDDRDTHVDLAAGDPQLDAAVLRQTLFGDIQPRHDLQPRDNRFVERMNLGRHRLHAEQTIHAVANHQPFFLRLDVDIAGLLRQSFQQQFADEPNDRRGLSHLRQFAVRASDLGQVIGIDVLAALRDQLRDRVPADAQLLFDQPDQIVPPSEHRLQAEAAQ